MWKASNEILHRCPNVHFPDHPSIDALANKFSSLFTNRISIIRASFSDLCSHILNPPHSRRILEGLSDATEAELRRLIRLAPCKSSDLDPILTGLMKDCIDILVTPITSIVHLSLSEGSFPLHLKSALVSPLLKKSNLDKDNLKNYRPESNLSFLSKVLEKVVAVHLNTHIISSNASNHYQSSAYRKFHSTKTTLLKIHNNILSSMDDGRVTALTLLDLSAAFHTIDHIIIMRRLDDWFGVTGKALDWFRSYLTGRWLRIKLGPPKLISNLESLRGQY